MTRDQQRRFYGPAWTAAFRACWMREGRGGPIVARPGRPSAAPGSNLPTPADVEDLAGRFGARDGRPMTESDLRRACRWITIGRDIPDGNDVENGEEMSRLVGLFRVLRDPENLDAVEEFLGGGDQQRRRLIQGIERLGLKDSTLQGWCYHFNRDQGSNWRALPVERLLAFNRYVRGRAGEVRRTAKTQPVDRQ